MRYLDSPAPKTVIQHQTENVSTAEYDLLPILIIIFSITIIAAFLSFRKSIAYSNFKDAIFTPPAKQTNTVQKSNKFSFKSVFNKENSELDLQLLRKIEWRRFEYVCETIFKELGLRTETIPFGADDGIDIKIYNDGSTHPDAVVQCKAWNSKQVGVKEMRELLGVMIDGKVNEGIFMTTNDFHKDAIKFAGNNNIDLKNGKDVIDLINKLPADARQRIYEMATKGDYTTPTCPSCGIKMVRRDKFWGCVNYPRGCSAKIFFS